MCVCFCLYAGVFGRVAGQPCIAVSPWLRGFRSNGAYFSSTECNVSVSFNSPYAMTVNHFFPKTIRVLFHVCVLFCLFRYCYGYIFDSVFQRTLWEFHCDWMCKLFDYDLGQRMKRKQKLISKNVQELEIHDAAKALRTITGTFTYTQNQYEYQMRHIMKEDTQSTSKLSSYLESSIFKGTIFNHSNRGLSLSFSIAISLVIDFAQNTRHPYGTSIKTSEAFAIIYDYGQ